MNFIRRLNSRGNIYFLNQSFQIWWLITCIKYKQRTYHLEECQVRLFPVTGRTTSAPIGWCVILPLSPTVSLLLSINVSCPTQIVQS